MRIKKSDLFSRLVDDAALINVQGKREEKGRRGGREGIKLSTQFLSELTSLGHQRCLAGARREDCSIIKWRERNEEKKGLKEKERGGVSSP